MSEDREIKRSVINTFRGSYFDSTRYDTLAANAGKALAKQMDELLPEIMPMFLAVGITEARFKQTPSIYLCWIGVHPKLKLFKTKEEFHSLGWSVCGWTKQAIVGTELEAMLAGEEEEDEEEENEEEENEEEEDEEGTFACDCCGEENPASEATDVRREDRAEDDGFFDSQWCKQCVKDYAKFCALEGVYFSPDDCGWVTDKHGKHMLSSTLLARAGKIDASTL